MNKKVLQSAVQMVRNRRKNRIPKHLFKLYIKKEVDNKMTNKEKKNLFIGVLTVVVLGFLAFLFLTNRAGATGGWNLVNTEYGECIANDAEDCENYGGTQTVTKYYEKETRQCYIYAGPNKVAVADAVCTVAKVGFFETTVQEKTIESEQECEVVPPVCEEEPEEEPTPTPTDEPKKEEPKLPGDGLSDGRSDGRSDGGKSSDFEYKDKEGNAVKVLPGTINK